MSSTLGFTVSMKPRLRLEVERQLIHDLSMYGIKSNKLEFDWSETCLEGHVTHYLEGELENWSGVIVREDGQIIAQGWIDFIHDGGDQPLFVFWDYLTITQHEKSIVVKNKSGIPNHVWEQLSKETKDICCVHGSQWSNDSLVLEWKQKQGN